MMEQAVNIGQLVIATVGLFASLGGAIILGWINIRTKLVGLELKCIELEKDMIRNTKDVDGIRDELPIMKAEIIEAINNIKIDFERIKPKRK